MPKLLLALLVTIVLAGCGTSTPSTSPSTDPRSPAPSTPAPTEVPATSLTCSSARPGDFTYSSDHDRLEQLADLVGDPAGLPSTFDDVDADELGLLIEEGFVDPDGDTNGSPTMWEFHAFLCAHPTARAIGFVAGALPGDTVAVASLETVYAATIDDELRAAARTFCRTTPEKTLTGHLECFWD